MSDNIPFGPAPAVLPQDNRQNAGALDYSTMLAHIMSNPMYRDQFLQSLSEGNRESPTWNNQQIAARTVENMNSPYINMRNGLLNMLGVDLSPSQKVQQDFMTIRGK